MTDSCHSMNATGADAQQEPAQTPTGSPIFPCHFSCLASVLKSSRLPGCSFSDPGRLPLLNPRPNREDKRRQPPYSKRRIRNADPCFVFQHSLCSRHPLLECFGNLPDEHSQIWDRCVLRLLQPTVNISSEQFHA